MALSRYTQKKWGMKTRAIVSPMGVESVDTGVTQVLRNNPDRLMFLIINLSDTAMQLGWFRDVSATKGIVLAASGGTIVFEADVDGELVGYDFYVHCGADSKALFIMVVEAE